MEGKSVKTLFLYKRKPVLKETDSKGEGAAKDEEEKFYVNAFCASKKGFDQTFLKFDGANARGGEAVEGGAPRRGAI